MKYFTTLMLLAVSFMAVAEEEGKAMKFDIVQTIYKVPVNKGVTPSDVQISILSKGSELNMKFVSHQPLSEEIKARGGSSRQVDIYQFCNPLDARAMLNHNIIFAAYMPCRIALVEDKNNQLWLMMIDLDMLIDNTQLPLELKKLALAISDKLKEIIETAVKGEF